MVLNNYGGETMLGNIEGLLPSQLWALRNQAPIGLLPFCSISHANIGAARWIIYRFLLSFEKIT